MLTLYPYPLPPAQTPLVDPQTGALTAKDGRFLILALLNRTGGSSGAPSVGVNLVAEAQPFNIVNDWSEFVTVSPPGIAVIPELDVGSEIIVLNSSTNTLTVNPQPNAEIDALGVGVGYPLANSKMQIFRCFAPQQIKSMQLG